jgi:hypothetical protein
MPSPRFLSQFSTEQQKTPTFFNDNPVISITGTRIRINSEDMKIARVSGMELRTQQPGRNQHANTVQNMHLHAPATPFLRQPPLPARRRQAATSACA